MGQEAVVARRASLEDSLAALEDVKGADFDELAASETFAQLAGTIRMVSSLATGRLQIFKEMRELDDRLGLTPKGRQALRWEIVSDQAPEDADDVEDEVTSRRNRRKRIAGG